jgi:hypothetical protein
LRRLRDNYRDQGGKEVKDQVGYGHACVGWLAAMRAAKNLEYPNLSQVFPK